jgi:hypothetical protein
MNYDTPLIDPRPLDPPSYWDPPEPEPEPYWLIESTDGHEDYATPEELQDVIKLYADSTFTASLHFALPD